LNLAIDVGFLSMRPNRGNSWNWKRPLIEKRESSRGREESLLKGDEGANIYVLLIIAIPREDPGMGGDVGLRRGSVAVEQKIAFLGDTMGLT
jgi:hypothetical protein